MAAQYAPRVSPSIAAARVADDLHSDSGYGGSMVGGDVMSPLQISNNSAQSESQHRNNVHQLQYNQNRVLLGRSINRVVETLKTLQKMNGKWPAHYPSVQRLDDAPALNRTQSFDVANSSSRPTPVRRAFTSLDQPEPANIPEPRLVTPQIAEEFNVLKLDLKLGALSPSELVHSLERSSIASLLDGKISQAVKHLMALRDRIEDTSSKVLVTGDLNSGKSTFCNALLRRKVLPEDQQPCTSIFCEVLDARENSNLEEVHAIPNGSTYNRNDESTYDVYTLDKLDDVVVDEEKYHQAKVYVEDVRSIDQSLLRNGVVDIALIDAPGLNSDSMKTTAVFTRQEEIDVVVFVVSAENQITQSSEEFIRQAANEKAYIFVVVNRFDNIRDKAKCRRRVMEKIERLSPQTFKDAHELVHFVSSNAVIDGDEPTKMSDFEDLEQGLRSFVLDKRARSKLAPAKTYLLNLLGDLETLANVNEKTVSAEIDRLNKELDEITPAYEKAVQARTMVSENVDKTVEEVTNKVYKSTRRTISGTISHIDDEPVVTYEGVLSAYAYAEATKLSMLQTIQNSVTTAEEHARSKTVEGVNSISALGLLHLGDEYVHKAFRPELMFTKKRHQLSREINISIDVTDFFDFDRQEQLAGAGMSLTVATVASSQLFGINSWVDGIWKATNLLGVRNTKKLVLPAVALAVAAGGWFILSELPKAVPRKLAKKIRRELAAMDYVHVNSDRIAKEIRKILKYPAEDLRSSLQSSAEKQGKTVEERRATKKESEVAQKYFGNFLREARQQKAAVSALDLEGAKA
ncbi:hypothetical protein EDC01DRAFT_12306 [Geopyxis carbonaria]|nr:hypothetical protein EDC01DRAFT_12306 [Geopyxis carbonaria]